jgi:hypothetical protein
MPARLPAVLTTVALAGVVAGGAVAGAQGTPDLTASLSGKKELKTGDSNGKGTYAGTFRSGGRLCSTLKYSGLTKPVAAHIHKGTSKQDGPIVLDLKPKFSNGSSSSCVTARSALASAIRKNPSGYYVNIHTQEYPDGAIRGQLAKR